MPEQIQWGQRGTAVLTGGGCRECGISIQICRPRFSDTAPLLLRCLQAEEQAWWRSYQKNSGSLYINPELEEFQDFQAVDSPDFDQLTVLTWRTANMDAPRSFYAGRAGGLVFTLTCRGPADADRALAIFAEEVSR